MHYTKSFNVLESLTSLLPNLCYSHSYYSIVAVVVVAVVVVAVVAVVVVVGVIVVVVVVVVAVVVVVMVVLVVRRTKESEARKQRVQTCGVGRSGCVREGLGLVGWGWAVVVGNFGCGVGGLGGYVAPA